MATKKMTCEELAIFYGVPLPKTCELLSSIKQYRTQTYWLNGETLVVKSNHRFGTYLHSVHKGINLGKLKDSDVLIPAPKCYMLLQCAEWNFALQSLVGKFIKNNHYAELYALAIIEEAKNKNKSWHKNSK